MLVTVLNYHQGKGYAVELVEESDPQVRSGAMEALALKPGSTLYNQTHPDENTKQPESSKTYSSVDSVRRNGRSQQEEIAYKEYLKQLLLAQMAQQQTQVAAQQLDPMSKGLPSDAVVLFKEAEKTTKKDKDVQRSVPQRWDSGIDSSNDSIVGFQNSLSRVMRADLQQFCLTV